MKVTIIKTIKWFARIASILMFLVFLVFFIGEGAINNIASLESNDLILLSLIPGLWIVGTVVAWKKELLGGSLICAAVVIFNLVSYIVYEKSTFPYDFLIILLMGILFLIVGISNSLDSKKQK